MNIMQDSEKENLDTIEDWIAYSELNQRIKDLIKSSLKDTFGNVHTLQIIKTATSESGQSQSEMFSDYETFARTIEDVFGNHGKNAILKRAGLVLDHKRL